MKVFNVQDPEISKKEVVVETPDELKENRKRAEEIIQKYRNNPTGDLAHFVRQCESSQALEEEDLKDN